MNTWSSSVFVLVIYIIGVTNSLVSLPDDDVNIDEESDETNSFTWEKFLTEHFALDELQNGNDGLIQNVTRVRDFLSEFGNTLDHCNLKIEESADLAKYLIKQHMENIVVRKISDTPSARYEINGIVLDDIDFQEELAAIPDEYPLDVDPTGSHDVMRLLHDLLVLVRDACNDLPLTIVELDMETQLPRTTGPQNMVEKLIRAMASWTREWTNNIRFASSNFIDSCVEDLRCQNNLKIVIDIFSSSLQRTNSINFISGLSLHNSIESSLFGNHIDNGEAAGTTHKNITDINSFMRTKLQKMSEILLHFSGLSETDDIEYINAAGVNTTLIGTIVDTRLLDDTGTSAPHTSENSVVGDPDTRIQRMIAAAVNVLRFPWDVENSNKAVLTLQQDVALREVPPTFLSLALESQLLQKPSEKFDTRSEKLRNMMQALSPAVFRVGGSSANFLTYDPTKFDSTQRNVGTSHSKGRFPTTGFFVDSRYGRISNRGSEYGQKPRNFNISTKINPFARTYHNGRHRNSVFYHPSMKPYGRYTRHAGKYNRNSYEVSRSHPKFRAARYVAQMHGRQLQGSEPYQDMDDNHPKHHSRQIKPNTETLNLSEEIHQTSLNVDIGSASNNGDRHRRSIPSPLNPDIAHRSNTAPASLNIAHRSNTAPPSPAIAHWPTRGRRSISRNHPKFLQHRNSLEPWRHDVYRHQTGGCQHNKSFRNYTIGVEDYDGLLDLCASLNWTLLFDLNQFLRDADGGWDATNARLLIEAAREKGADVVWQLGNEPNSYAHKFPFHITGRGMADDVTRLRHEVHGSSLWQRMMASLGLRDDDVVHVVGPDVTRPRLAGDPHVASTVGTDSVQFLEEFLESKPGLVDAITWHQYYICGRNATTEQFTSPAVLDLFVRQLATVRDVRDRMAPHTPIWITETGSAYGGGAPGLSNRFAGAFLWLDKLGVAATGGADVVARQSVFGGHYAMLDANYDPNPDYWVSVLHKQLVGGKVLEAELQGAPPTLRLYAHCSKETHAHYRAGGVVVYGINMAPESVAVSLGDEGHPTPLLQYLLTPALGDITARDVLLNGTPLTLSPDGSLPPLEPKSVSSEDLTVPGHSVIFWVLPQAGARACQ